MTVQIIMLALMLFNLMFGAYLHGKPKTGNHSVWVSVAGVAIQLVLLYAGGFFDVFFK